MKKSYIWRNSHRLYSYGNIQQNGDRVCCVFSLHYFIVRVSVYVRVPVVASLIYCSFFVCVIENRKTMK